MAQHDITLTPDTGMQENAAPHPDDPQKTASGSSHAPGGGGTGNENASDMTHGGEGYPGPRSGGETGKTGETPHAATGGEESGADQTPTAGDTDPGSSASAEETGQAGPLSSTSEDPQKNKGNAWNG